MPSTTKARKTSARSKSTNGSAPKQTTRASSRRPAAPEHKLSDAIGGVGTIAKGAAAATVGTAVAAFAGRALIASRSRRKRVLGVPMPRRHHGMKGMAKRVAGFAGDLEKHSLDVSKASGRAKEAAKMLS